MNAQTKVVYWCVMLDEGVYDATLYLGVMVNVLFEVGYFI